MNAKKIIFFDGILPFISFDFVVTAALEGNCVKIW